MAAPRTGHTHVADLRQRHIRKTVETIFYCDVIIRGDVWRTWWVLESVKCMAVSHRDMQ